VSGLGGLGYSSGRSFLSFAKSAEKFFHPSGHFFGAVDGKGKVRNVTDAHALAELGADVGARGHEALEGGLFLLLVTVDGDVDAGGLASGGKHDVGDVAGGDTGIGELSFEHGADFLGEGVRDSIAMMSSGSLLGHMFQFSKLFKITKVGL